MSTFIVTVRLRPDQRPGRPQMKEAGTCPASGGHCDDINGPEHSILIEARSTADACRIVRNRGFANIRRVERVARVS